MRGALGVRVGRQASEFAGDAQADGVGHSARLAALALSDRARFVRAESDPLLALRLAAQQRQCAQMLHIGELSINDTQYTVDLGL